MDWGWYLFSFSGRINRAKWWLGVLLLIVVTVAIWFVILPLLGFSMFETASPTTSAVIGLVVLAIIAYPATAIMVKRLNDRDRPAWLAAVFWLPSILSILSQLTGIGFTMVDVGGQQLPMPNTTGWAINILSLIVAIWAFVELGCLRGTRGPNKHGPDPLTGLGHA